MPPRMGCTLARSLDPAPKLTLAAAAEMRYYLRFVFAAGSWRNVAGAVT